MDSSYSKCRTKALAGTAQGMACEDLADFCAATRGPYTIPSDQGNRTATDQESCYHLAVQLAQAGANVSQSSPSNINSNYNACRALGNPSQTETCQEITDICLGQDAGPYTFSTQQSSYTDNAQGSCLQLAAKLASEGQKLTSASADVALASRSKNAYLIAFIKQHPGSPVAQMMKDYGVDEVASLCRGAGEHADRLLTNLDQLSHLITSKDELRRASRLLLDFIQKAKRTCKNNFPAEVTNLGHIKGLITSLDDITSKGNELLVIMPAFDDVRYQFIDDMVGRDGAGLYRSISPLIVQHGFAPFQEMYRAGNIHALDAINSDSAKRLISTNGFDAVKDLVVASGDSADRVLFDIGEHGATWPLLTRCGIRGLIEALKSERARGKDLFPVLISHGLTAADQLIKTPDDLKRIVSTLISMALQVDDMQRGNFIKNLHQYRAFITPSRNPATPDEFLMRLGSRFVTIYRELKGTYLLEEYWKTKPPTCLSDIEADYVPALQRIASSSSYWSELANQALIRTYGRRKLYFTALKHLTSYENRTQKHTIELDRERLRIATGLIMQACNATNPASVDLGDGNTRSRQQLQQEVVSELNSLLSRQGQSALAGRAQLLQNALTQGTFSFQATQAGTSGLSLVKFGGINHLTLVYIDDDMPEVVPGNARIQGNNIIVPQFDGRYEVTFQNARKTIPANNDALIEARLLLPSGFYANLLRISCTDDPLERAYSDRSYYAVGSNSIRLKLGDGSAHTVVHELGHHWDLGITTASPDPSNLFYNLSWKGIPTSREQWGGACTEEWTNNEKMRGDFDHADFASWYGLCDRAEDLGTMTDNYVIEGQSLRKRAREQMAKGNFELGAKYLFVRHIMPFQGREYGVNAQSTSFEIAEFEQAYKASTSPHSKNAAIDALLNKLPKPAGTAPIP